MLTGARAGARFRLAADFATLGRHPSSDLPFDPERDLDVSARHAAVFRQGPTYVVRDLGSTNGTWVNGTRVRSDQALEPGDRIRLGSRGPEVEFAILESGEPGPAPATAAGPGAAGTVSLPAPDAAPPPRRTPVAPPHPPVAAATTDLRIRMEVARQTDRLRTRLFAAIVLIAVAIAGIIGWMAWSGGRGDAGADRERERLLTQVDSLQRLLSQASGQATDLRSALDSARQETSSLRGSIAAPGSAPDQLERFDSAVGDALARHGPLLRAAGFDAAAIETAQSRTTALIFVEYRDARAATATGFVARSRGDTAWVVTARHVVTDPGGGEANRLALSLARRAGVYRGQLLGVHDSLDVAVVRIVSRVPFPAVRGLASAAPRPGDPVALLGYPLGLDLPMPADWARSGVLPTTTVATVSRVLPDLIQLDGYGVDGASGSPVFSATGEVVAMLYGGEPGTGGRIIYAVPAAGIVELLDRLAPMPER